MDVAQAQAREGSLGLARLAGRPISGVGFRAGTQRESHPEHFRKYLKLGVAKEFCY